MNRRVLEILTYVMQELRETPLEDIDLQLVVDILSEQGFSDEDISVAMSWLMNDYDRAVQVTSGHPPGIPRPLWRMLSDSERSAISPNAFSYLIKLRELELLSDDMMENIIEKAVNLPSLYVDVEQMQDLIAAVVLDFENSASEGYFQYTVTRLPH
ncbi:DUF494 family protein [candidate division KSB1 bacterium]|nr:DUF494 family protein [candidate division KSB1 bacterium]